MTVKFELNYSIIAKVLGDYCIETLKNLPMNVEAISVIIEDNNSAVVKIECRELNL